MTESKMVICIAGPTAGGKTSTTEMLQEEFGAERVRGSAILAEIAKQRNIPTDKVSLQNLYLSERAIHGEDFLARMMAERAFSIDAKVVITEGIRRVTDIACLEQMNTKAGRVLKFFFIDASLEVRFERYNSRQIAYGETAIAMEAFMALEKNAAENELSAVREMIREKGAVINTDNLTQEEVFRRVLREIYT